MSEGEVSADMILANVPVKVPSPQHFSDIGCTDDMYWEFRQDVETMTQQIVHKYLVQLLDAVTEGAGMVAEPVVKAAVNVDKALNTFVKLQEDGAWKDQEREEVKPNAKRNRNRRRKTRRKGRNSGRKPQHHGGKG